MADFDSALPIRDNGGSITIDAVALDIRTLTSSDTVTANAGTGNFNVVATNLDIRDLTSVSDSVEVLQATASDLKVAISDSAGAAFSIGNPLPVLISNTTPGTEVWNYTTSVLASTVSGNHDYTVANANGLELYGIWVSGSGKLKVEVQLPSGTTKFVGFSSTSSPNILIDLKLNGGFDIADTEVIRLIITNLDNQSQSVYSTVSGVLLP